MCNIIPLLAYNVPKYQKKNHLMHTATHHISQHQFFTWSKPSKRETIHEHIQIITWWNILYKGKKYYIYPSMLFKWRTWTNHVLRHILVVIEINMNMHISIYRIIICLVSFYVITYPPKGIIVAYWCTRLSQLNKSY